MLKHYFAVVASLAVMGVAFYWLALTRFGDGDAKEALLAFSLLVGGLASTGHFCSLSMLGRNVLAQHRAQVDPGWDKNRKKRIERSILRAILPSTTKWLPWGSAVALCLSSTAFLLYVLAGIITGDGIDGLLVALVMVLLSLMATARFWWKRSR